MISETRDGGRRVGGMSIAVKSEVAALADHAEGKA